MPFAWRHHLASFKAFVQSVFTWNDWLGFLMLFANDLAVFMTAAVLLLESSGGAFTKEDVYRHMFPGIGLLILTGSLVSGLDARWRSRRDGQRVCALPFGLNLPDVINFSIMCNQIAFDPNYGKEIAWKTGCAANFFSSMLLVVVGLIMWVAHLFHKDMGVAQVQIAVECVLPAVSQAATLAGIALSLISGYGFLGAFAAPGPVGLPPLVAVLLVGLILKRLEYGRSGQPSHRSWPGVLVLAVVVIASLWANLLRALGMDVPLYDSRRLPPWSVGSFRPMWFFGATELALLGSYLGVVLPLAVATLVGTVNVVATALPRSNAPSLPFTLLWAGGLSAVSALLGVPLPCCVYIGQPLFYAAGAAAGYSIINGLIMFVATLFCLLPFVSYVVPDAALSPVLVLIGIEITSEAFRLAVGDARLPPSLALALENHTTALAVSDAPHSEPTEPTARDRADAAAAGQRAAPPAASRSEAVPWAVDAAPATPASEPAADAAAAAVPLVPVDSGSDAPLPAGPDDRAALLPAPVPGVARLPAGAAAALFPAVAIGLLPALAAFAWQHVEQLARAASLPLGDVVRRFGALAALQQGYILTSLLWSAVLYFATIALEPVVLRRHRRLDPDRWAAVKAAALMGALAVLSLLGLLHTVAVSPNAGLRPAFVGQNGWYPDALLFAGGYVLCALMFGALYVVLVRRKQRV